jgi:uncharacterized membrane protein YqjE
VNRTALLTVLVLLVVALAAAGWTIDAVRGAGRAFQRGLRFDA